MNKRMWLTGLAGLLAVVPTGWAQEKDKETVTTRESKTEKKINDRPDFENFTFGGREAAADLLRQRVESVDWKDETFEAVLDWLKTQGEGRVNVVPKWGPLGIESVTRESVINLQLNNTTIADVLNEVVDQLSEDGQIQYRGIGNKLTISTKGDFGRTLYVRVYDVGDLLFRVENFGQEAPKIDLQKTNRSSSGGGGGQSIFSGGGGSGGSQNQDTERLERENEERLNKLRHLIEQTIAPETWDLTGSDSGPGGGGQQTGGGGRGRIRVLNTSLIVLNTIEVHEMIAGAFNFTQ